MSSVITPLDSEQCVVVAENWSEIISVTEDSTNIRVLDTSIILLFVLGALVVIAGIFTSIWPILIAGLGPIFLALIDTYRRSQERKHVTN